MVKFRNKVICEIALSNQVKIMNKVADIGNKIDELKDVPSHGWEIK